MKLSQKYFRIRLTLLLAPLATLFMAFMSFLLVSDYSTNSGELMKDNSTIDTIIYNSYIENRLLKSNKIHSCLDIKIKERPYYIRLTDKSHSDNWKTIQTQSSTNDKIEFWYFKRLLQDTILYNPSKLVINQKVLIGLDDTKRMNSYALCAVASMTLLFAFTSILAFLTYKKDLFNGDKILFKKDKLKFLGRWILE